jgi:predicted enzyme related to lactoylglutathione lyase
MVNKDTVMKLSGVMIGSEQSEVLGDFYTKLLGKPGMEGEGWYGFMIGTGSMMIGPHSEVKGQNNTPGRIMATFETDDVKGEFERMKGLGATVVAEPYTPREGDDTMLLATLADPDGNYFQLASPWVKN